MTFTIELRRAGMSRVSEDNIPLVARIVNGAFYGRNLLAQDRLTDIEGAKVAIQNRINQKFGLAVTIKWVDATREEK